MLNVFVRLITNTILRTFILFQKLVIKKITLVRQFSRKNNSSKTLEPRNKVTPEKKKSVCSIYNVIIVWDNVPLMVADDREGLRGFGQRSEKLACPHMWAEVTARNRSRLFSPEARLCRRACRGNEIDAPVSQPAPGFFSLVLMEARIVSWDHVGSVIAQWQGWVTHQRRVARRCRGERRTLTEP